MTDGMIPGLENVTPLAGHKSFAAGEMEKSARATIAELGRLELIQPWHSVQTQLLISLCIAYDQSVKSGRAKAYALANLAAQIGELFKNLPKPIESGSENDAWAQAEVEILNEYKNRTAQATDTA